MARRAVVVGGSLGGLFAAGFLQSLGWRVDVYERVADDLATRGAGIGTHDALFDAMRELGIVIDDSLGLLVAERVCLDRHGNTVHTKRLEQVMSHWARIYRAVRPCARHYDAARNFVGFERDGAQVVARFDDGGVERADLLIGADGLRSTVRAQLCPQAEPRYAGYVGWRGVVKGIDLPGRYYFVLPPDEMMLCYPVPTGEWNYVWYRPCAEAALRDLCTDASGVCHGSAIAPPLIRPEIVLRLKKTARAVLAPEIAVLVERSQPFFQAIFDLESPRMQEGAVVLIGDAAFVARPHIGMGVTKAALDARCLARSLDVTNGNLEAALARYERLRTKFGLECVRRSRRIGAYIEARSRPTAAWRVAELDQRPERILSEVGAVLSGIPELALEI